MEENLEEVFKLKDKEKCRTLSFFENKTFCELIISSDSNPKNPVVYHGTKYHADGSETGEYRKYKKILYNAKNFSTSQQTRQEAISSQ